MPFDKVSNVLLRFKADTKDAQKNVKKLEKSQRELAQKTIEGQERANAEIEKQIAILGKVAIGVGAAVGAYQALAGSISKFAEVSKLQAASQGADIAKIQKAAGGLISRTQAMQLAAESMGSAFGATQKDLELYGKLIKKISDNGFETATAFEEVKKAAVEANSEGLKQLGVQIKAQSDTLEGHNQILAQTAELTRDVSGASTSAGQEIEKTSVAWRDAVDRLGTTLGALAVKLTPVVKLITGLVEAVTDALDLLTGGGDDPNQNDSLRKIALIKQDIEHFRQTGQLDTPLGRTRLKQLEQFRRDFGPRNFVSPTSKRGRSITRAAEFDRQRQLSATLAGPVLGPVEPPGGQRPIDNAVVVIKRAVVRLSGPGLGSVEATSLGQLARAPSTTSGAGVSDFAKTGEFGTGIPGASGISANFEKTFKESKSTMQTFGEGIQMHSATIVDGFASIIDGTKSVSEAFADMTASILMSISFEMIAHSVSELAKAFIFPEAAPKHLLAAAKAGAAGAAIGVLARTVAGSGNGTVTNSVPAGGAGAIGAGQQIGGRNTTIFVGSEFGDNPRANAARLGRAFDRSNQMEGAQDVVAFA